MRVQFSSLSGRPALQGLPLLGGPVVVSEALLEVDKLEVGESDLPTGRRRRRKISMRRWRCVLDNSLSFGRNNLRLWLTFEVPLMFSFTCVSMRICHFVRQNWSSANAASTTA